MHLRTSVLASVRRGASKYASFAVIAPKIAPTPAPKNRVGSAVERGALKVGRVVSTLAAPRSKLHHLADGLINSAHQLRRQLRQRALDKPTVVDCAKLIDQQVRAAAEPSSRRHMHPQRFSSGNQIGRQGHDKRGRVAGIE